MKLVTHLVQTTLLNCNLEEHDIDQYKDQVKEIHYQLENSSNMTGWIDYPLQNHDELFKQIQNLKNEICAKADVLVVIGIGGSFLGARAVQDALTPYFGIHKNGIEVIYVGHHMSGAYMKQILTYLSDKEVYINVISKSGGTMEPALAFRVLRQYMEERYGEEAVHRIIVTTDPEKGLLKKTADLAGYRRFEIPPNIGGRYSVLTPVGLLPLAIAGIEIGQFMEGAKKAACELKDPDLANNHAYQYAVMRNKLYNEGYSVELLASFEPSLKKFHEWWMQLFGESEGKERKGLFPTCVTYSTDLHAIGQFIQEGSPILFETLLHFHDIEGDYIVPYDERNEDGLNYLAGRSFNEINATSKQGTALAHAEGGVPVIQLEMAKLDAYHLGYLIYFFMKACAMSAKLIDVNPFDQPGVEAYKKKMLELLKS
ncbi:glucose-6-phosphate isomerase [Ureibacillus sp. FSL K6-0786]|uniref:glucose-6-phosphate isomerase n=1 Tax=Ureibacillus sp. FSL K6-0786 TaxID=2954607 RepID=UPI0030DD9D54